MKLKLSITQIIMLSFLGLILLGSLILALPVSATGDEPVPYLDALFTATTATCVTGLVTLPICKCADITDPDVIRQLAIANVDVVIIAHTEKLAKLR